jgi:vacuolar-type H+-ATPase subunit E/Vma4
MVSAKVAIPIGLLVVTIIVVAAILFIPLDEPTIKKDIKIIEETIETDVKIIEKTVKEVVDKTEKTVEEVVDKTEKTVEEVVDKTEKTVEEVVDETEKTVEKVVDETEKTVEEVVDETEETVEEVVDKTEKTVEKVVDEIKKTVVKDAKVIEKTLVEDINLTDKAVNEYIIKLEQETIDRVNKVIDQYKANPDLTMEELDIGDSPYVFVADYDTEINLAHPDKSILGKVSPSFHDSNLSHDKIMSDLKDNGEVWIEYQWTNYSTDKVEHKTSWMTLHDGKIFGSGYYSGVSDNVLTQEELAKHRINNIITLNKAYPDLPIDKIDVGKDPYVFVINAETEEILAHGYPSRVGEETKVLHNADESFTTIMNKLETNGETIMHYEWENPETGKTEQKTSWLKLYDGKIFGSGYLN